MQASPYKLQYFTILESTICKEMEETNIQHLSCGVAPAALLGEDLLPDELVEDVGQVGHHEQDDHRQGEVRRLLGRPGQGLSAAISADRDHMTQCGSGWGVLAPGGVRMGP